MAAKSTPLPVVLDGNEEALVLAGPPHAVRGELSLRNPTDARVVVRQLQIEGAAPRKGRGKAATSPAALPGPPIALRRIVLRHGQARRIPVSLQLDASTPPGTYRALMAVGDQQREVVVHVAEEVSLDIIPGDIVVVNRPGETVTKKVVFVNRGNVPVTVPKLGALVLDEDLAHCRALRGALADVGATMKTLDDFAAALGRRYKKIYETLVLKVQNEALVVDPGRTVSAELTITQPEKADREARFTCVAPIATSSLSFTIVPG